MTRIHHGVIVGAYATAPPAPQLDQQAEGELVQRLGEVTTVRGLEVPWRGTPYGYDTYWYAERTPAHWDLVVTTIGGTMAALGTQASYGLASVDPEGRAMAVRDAAQLRADVAALNDALGRHAVIGVELHSAPSTMGAASSTSALTESLREIDSWDWDGAAVLLEHCDRKQTGLAAAKGFLDLESELEAIDRSQAGAGLVVNWGRSAIELREPDAVPAHVARARAAGVLRAVVLSGASDVATDYGDAWADAHHPFAPTPGSNLGCRGSLLTDERAAATLGAAGDLDWLGLKISRRPAGATIEQRLALISDGVDRVLTAHGTS